MKILNFCNNCIFPTTMNILYLLSVIINFSISVISEQAISEQSDKEYSNLFEGDIILQPNQLQSIKNKNLHWRSRTILWPNNILHYDFSPNISDEHRQIIETAMLKIEQNTCVKFRRRDETTSGYAHFMNSKGRCASFVGYHPALGALPLFIGPHCSTGTIQHELLHALGLWHEHTRYDRDRHIQIIWENIKPGREVNFRKRTKAESHSLDLPYDYGSILHYSPYAFTKYKKSPTIMPFDINAINIMGQRIRLSNLDIAKVNRLYNCPSTHYYTGDDVIEAESSVGTFISQINKLDR